MMLGATISATAFYPIFWHILPIDWAGLDGTGAGVTAVGLWVYFMGLGALGMAFFPYAYGLLRTGGVADVLLLPCLWVLFEHLSGLAFALGVYKPLVALSPYLSLGALSMVGLLATDDPGILQAATLGGSSGLSFIVVLCNALLAHTAVSFSRGKSLRGPVRALGLVAVVWAAVRLTLPSQEYEKGPTVAVALISSRSPHLTPHASAEDPVFNARMLALLEEASDASIVVFPEGTNALTPAARTALKARDPRAGYIVLDSRAVKDPKTGALRRELEALDTETMISARTYKRFLVPVGEYAPLVFRPIARLLGGEALLEQFGALRSYVSGEPSPPITTRHGVLGAHFCEEILSPTLYQQDVSRGADILVNASSHAWYHDSNAVFERMKRAAQIRAAESRRFMLVASDASPSFVLDAYGRTVTQSVWCTEGVLRAEVPRIHTRTPYSRLGPSVLLFPLTLCVWALRRRMNERS